MKLVPCDKQYGKRFRVRPMCLMLRVTVANLAGKQNIKMAFPQFAELWKLIDLLVRKDFRQANLESLFQSFLMSGQAEA
jgi:hypothetical protein